MADVAKPPPVEELNKQEKKDAKPDDKKAKGAEDDLSDEDRQLQVSVILSHI